MRREPHDSDGPLESDHSGSDLVGPKESSTASIPSVESALDRQSFVRRLGRAAAALILGAGALGRSAAPAVAQTNPDGCCILAFPPPNNQCAGSGGAYTCPSGWYKRIWYCCQNGSKLRGCGECTRNIDTCFQGPFLCSKTWITTINC